VHPRAATFFPVPRCFEGRKTPTNLPEEHIGVAYGHLKIRCGISMRIFEFHAPLKFNSINILVRLALMKFKQSYIDE
jgi:hypothetical protein